MDFFDEYPIAGIDDVRRFWTKIMSGKITAPIQYCMKASEMLARSYGMFREGTESEEKKPDSLDMSSYTTEKLREIVYSGEDGGLT